MALTEKDIPEIGQDEDQRWKHIHNAVINEIRQSRKDFHQDRKLARELTSQIVAAGRDEDKAALASDEAVAHGLSNLRKSKSEGLESLIEQPYFARVVTDEEGKQVEFKLSTASFPAARIIDWRKAPISKLYYDYKEGDEFSETIQGRDREGSILLRRSYQGERELLHTVEMKEGTLHRIQGEWKLAKKGDALSRNPQHDGHLPPILSLITPEQFRLITRDPVKPMMIQGIAGSGKTTVALHRLAWLLHEDNSNASPEKCLVVMFNRSLKAYVETTLPELKIPNVPIRTYHQWLNTLVSSMVGPRPRGDVAQTREAEQFKSSALCLTLLQQFVTTHPLAQPKDAIDALFAFFKYLQTQTVFWPRWEVIKNQLKEQAEKKISDFQDDTILLHLIYTQFKGYPSTTVGALNLCDHIVIDEAQDFGLMEIRALLNSLNKDRTVTIVGDIAQKIVMGRNFDSWEEVLRDAGFKETTPITLNISHRTTLEIMEVANFIRKQNAREGVSKAVRHGPIPVHIRAESVHYLVPLIGKWITARLNENRRALCAIICRWPKQAQYLVEHLRKQGHPMVRLGHRDQFDFSPGIVITNVQQVKGLEFRNVLIVEPSEEVYSPYKDEDRNLLYVAVTRAELRLDFIGSRQPTRLLPPIRTIGGDEIEHE